jgi:hypothetical protein
MPAPATMCPAQRGSRRGAHDRAGDDDASHAGVEKRRI